MNSHLRNLASYLCNAKRAGWIIVTAAVVYLAVDTIRTELPPATSPRCWVVSVATPVPSDNSTLLQTLCTIRLDYQGLTPTTELLGELFQCRVYAAKQTKAISGDSILARTHWSHDASKHDIEFNFIADISAIPLEAGAIVVKATPSTPLIDTSPIVAAVRPEIDQYGDPLPPGATARMRFNLGIPNPATGVRIVADKYARLNTGNPMASPINSGHRVLSARPILEGEDVFIYAGGAFVWNLQSNKVTQVFPGGKYAGYSAVSLDQRTLTTRGAKTEFDFTTMSCRPVKKVVELPYFQKDWDQGKAELLPDFDREYKRMIKRISHAQILFHHNRFIWIGKDRRVHLWDTKNLRGLANWTMPAGEGVYYDYVACSTTDGERIATINRETVTVWDTLAGQPVQRFEFSRFSSIKRVEFSHDASMIAIVNQRDGCVHLFDVPTGEFLFRCPSPETKGNWFRHIGPVACGKNNTMVVVTHSRDYNAKKSRNCITFWDLNQIETLAKHSRE